MVRIIRFYFVSFNRPFSRPTCSITMISVTELNISQVSSTAGEAADPHGQRLQRGMCLPLSFIRPHRLTIELYIDSVW